MKLGIADCFGVCEENDEGQTSHTQALIRAIEEPYVSSGEEEEDSDDGEQESHTRIKGGRRAKQARRETLRF